MLKDCANEGKLFAAWSLFDSLAEQLSGMIKVRLGQKIRGSTANKYERSYERYRQIFKPIQDNSADPDLTGLDTKDSKIVTKLASIAGILAGEPYKRIPHDKCVQFIQETKWDTELDKLESDAKLFTNNLATLLQLSIFAAQALGALGRHISTRRQSNSDRKEFLIVPVGAISRAVNLMHPDTGEPYFGGMVIVVRQHPRPDDNQIVISGVNKETIDNMGSQSVEYIQRRARHTRDTFLAVPQIFSQLPEKIHGVAMKKPLVWTLAVNLTQLIGRSTRGGRKTVVWFTDAAFMPQTSQGNRPGDTDKNSLLLAVRNLLGDAISQGGSSGRIIQTLYGPVYYPLTRLTHFISGVSL